MFLFFPLSFQQDRTMGSLLTDLLYNISNPRWLLNTAKFINSIVKILYNSTGHELALSYVSRVCARFRHIVAEEGAASGTYKACMDLLRVRKALH